jgi:hypothetical protein
MGPQFIAFRSNPGSSSAYRSEVTAGASLDRFINSHLRSVCHPVPPSGLPPVLT